MKVLQAVKPTPEQMKIILDYRPGATVIRGAAGSGKTTTALLRLNFLVGFWAKRSQRLSLTTPVNVLVLTYNKTLRGYIAELVEQQLSTVTGVNIEVTTFAKWAHVKLGTPSILEEERRRFKLMQLGDGLDLDPAFVADEADYALGRFLPGKLDSYLSAKREGRGKSPKFDKALREQFLSEVIGPYIDWKDEVGEKDWNDLAVELADNPPSSEYDVVVIDEAQDFAANQIRAVSNYLAEDHSITFLLDAAQRIYPRYFSWSEVGVSITPNNSHKLNRNHRNTKEIAAFARPIVTGLDIGDDGALPDFSSCQKSGPKPTILRGRYSSQVAYCIKLICKTIDLKKQSVAFLHAKGGGWFDTLRKKLSAAGIEHVEIARSSDWPSGPANVALCTMHSAKGLEFDHVFIIGLNAETTPHGSEPGDSQLEALRRLLAMAVSRARESVVVGFKPQEASSLVEFFDPVTYVGVDL